MVSAYRRKSPRLRARLKAVSHSRPVIPPVVYSFRCGVLGLMAILDRYTESAKAITALTLHYLYNVVELRTSQYKRLAYKISA